jgi:hypothetical protein
MLGKIVTAPASNVEADNRAAPKYFPANSPEYELDVMVGFGILFNF